MFLKKCAWFLISGGGLVMLAVLLLLQSYSGPQRTLVTASSVPLQSYPARRTTAPQSFTKSPHQKVRTSPTQSDQLESVPSTSDSAATVDETTPLEADTTELSSLVDSLSAEDLEELEGLTLRDFLSEEEQKELDRHVLRHLEEFTEITPKIVNLREKIIALRMEVERLELNLDNPRDKGVWDKYVEDTRAMREELLALEERLPTLEGVLINDELDDDYQIDKEKIQRIVKEILDGKGYPWYQP